MKKIALIITIVGFLGFSSCSKSDATVCKITSSGVESTTTIEDGKATDCSDGQCTAAVDIAPDTKEEFIQKLVDKGYKCE